MSWVGIADNKFDVFKFESVRLIWRICFREERLFYDNLFLHDMVRCLKFLLPLCFIGIATVQSVHAALHSVNAAQESFARVWGTVRYFSPNPYTQEWSEDEWFTVCLYLFERLPEDGDPQMMLELLRPLAPNASISASPDDERRGIVGDMTDYRYRQHHGGGKAEIHPMARMLYKEYRHYEPFYSELVVCDDTPNTSQAGIAYAYEVSDGLYLHLPVAERIATKSSKQVWGMSEEI